MVRPVLRLKDRWIDQENEKKIVRQTTKGRPLQRLFLRPSTKLISTTPKTEETKRVSRIELKAFIVYN